MDDGDRRRFVKELLECMRNIPTTVAETWPAEVRDYSLRVKSRLTELSELLDARSLKYYGNAVEYVEKLDKNLEEVMSVRRNSRAGGVVGNVVRIGGTLAYAHPVGKAAFWIGLAISAACDLHAEWKGREIQGLAMEINERLNRSKDAFRPVAGAIRRLDEAIQERTGCSIFKEEFHNFLREADFQADNVVPCAANVVPKAVTNVTHRNNLIELARNRELLRLLQEVGKAICREDVLFFTIVAQALFAASFCEQCINTSTALQVGELCARGLVMFFEYRQDKITLQYFGNEIGLMRKQLQAIEQVSPYL